MENVFEIQRTDSGTYIHMWDNGAWKLVGFCLSETATEAVIRLMSFPLERRLITKKIRS